MSDHCYYVLPCDSKSDPLHRRIQQMTGGYCITSGWLTCPCQLGGFGSTCVTQWQDKQNNRSKLLCFICIKKNIDTGRWVVFMKNERAYGFFGRTMCNPTWVAQRRKLWEIWHLQNKRTDEAIYHRFMGLWFSVLH